MLRNLFLLSALFLAAAVARTVAAGEAQVSLPALPDGFERGGTAAVAEVVDGDTLRLDDGRALRLIGIQAPKLPLERPDFEPWPLADAARTHLQELTAGARVTLYFGEARRDRYGRLLAHLVRDDGLWLQAAMLEAGLARVYTFADNRLGVEALYAAEDTARAKGAGIWADAFYRVRCAADLDGEGGAAPPEGFQIIQGRVVDAADVRGTIYLNFGPNYRSDFTIRIQPRQRRAFAGQPWFEAGPDSLDGAIVEVRGWLFTENGPMIDLDHPEPLRFLGEHDTAPACR